MGNKKCYTNFHKFISKLIKRCSNNIQITEECKDILNHLIRVITQLFISGCTQLVMYSKKVTINPDTLRCLVLMWFNPDTADKIIQYYNNHWEYYSNNSVKGIRKSERADLSLPPSRIRELYKKSLPHGQQLGEPCYVCLTAIVEYMLREILSIAIDLLRIENKHIMHGRHLFAALQQCTQLHPVFKNTIVVGYGVVVCANTNQ